MGSPFNILAPSSSGLGRWPLKPETAGSNPVGATTLQGDSNAILRVSRLEHHRTGLFGRHYWSYSGRSEGMLKENNSYVYSLLPEEIQRVVKNSK